MIFSLNKLTTKFYGSILTENYEKLWHYKVSFTTEKPKYQITIESNYGRIETVLYDIFLAILVAMVVVFCYLSAAQEKSIDDDDEDYYEDDDTE